MPELPEVETLRRGLARTLTGRRIVAADLLKPKIFSGLPGHSLSETVGATVESVRRRAKYLIVDLSNSLSVVVHLSLAGQIVVEQPGGERVAGGHPVPKYEAPLPHKQTSVILKLDDGSVLFLTDIRQFAHLWIAPTDEVESVIPEKRLGIELVGPEFTAEELSRRLRRRPKARLKPLLLDQKILAGLGNIYVDESLWGAGLHPLRTAGSLGDEEIEQLYAAIRDVVDLALTHGVAHILNGRAVAGAKLPRIHGREGQPCLCCGRPIEKFRVGGRGTYVCRVCQPEEVRG
jgi:formamidopyrimidine-DNA glycosylase